MSALVFSRRVYAFSCTPGRIPSLTVYRAVPSQVRHASRSNRRALRDMERAYQEVLETHLWGTSPAMAVLPPLTKLVKNYSLKEGAVMLWHYSNILARTYLLRWRTWYDGLQHWWPWPKSILPFRKDRSAVPTAREFHTRMNTAVARGDEEALWQVCSPRLAQKMATVIQGRPPNPPGDKSVLHWEVLKYKGRPRALMALSIPDSPTVESASLPVCVYHQIVRIKSVQRLARWRPLKRGENTEGLEVRGNAVLVPGTSKVHEMQENVVLVWNINKETGEVSEKKLAGIMPDATPEAMEETYELHVNQGAKSTLTDQNKRNAEAFYRQKYGHYNRPTDRKK